MTRSGNDSEQDLVKFMRQGDGKAMKTVYCRHIGYLTAVCSRYVIGDEDIKDVLQESFIKIFTSAGKFEYQGEGSLRAWMTRIVVNEALKFLKSKDKLDTVLYEWDLPDAIDDDEEPSVGDVPASVIQAMIRELPVGYRTVFNLYVFEKKSHKEIASILHIKENTSASQFHKAKRLLAKGIKEYNSASNGRAMD